MRWLGETLGLSPRFASWESTGGLSTQSLGNAKAPVEQEV